MNKRIAVAITTHNRPDQYKETIINWLNHSSLDIDFVVVDDGSDDPLYAKDINHFKGAGVKIFRFETPQGIAVAKNKCLELCEDYDYIFLSDDDFYPIANDWWKPYLESGENHLMYIFTNFKTRALNDTVAFYKDDKITAYSHARGCMLFFTKKCLQIAGGMRSEFGKWGYEHPDLSNRIYNLGLSSFQYADVNNSHELFYSADEHETVKSTCWGIERRRQIQANLPLYERLKYSTQYVPYKPSKQAPSLSLPGKQDLILTCYFTSQTDPQRGMKWINNLDNEIKVLLESWGNNSDSDFICLHDDQSLTDSIKTFIQPYFQRWISYRQFLIKNRKWFGKVFCVDATDVEILKNPFTDMKDGTLYTGDELDFLTSTWLNHHHKHPALLKFNSNNRLKKLLNAGLLGGDIDTVISFCGHMIRTYGEMIHDQQLRNSFGPGMTDMGVFNYVARTFFSPSHGQHVNTTFKANEYNDISWFKHK